MLTALWLVLGTLAGAAVFTALIWFLYWVIGCCVFNSDALGWLMLPNFTVGPSTGAALGLVGALHFCGFHSAARIAAIVAGIASLAFIYTVYALNERKNWPGVYTVRQSVGVVFRCAGDIVGVSFVLLPLPCLLSVGLIVWGFLSLRS